MDETMRGTILRPVTPERADTLLDELEQATHDFHAGLPGAASKLERWKARVRLVLIGAMERVPVPPAPQDPAP